LLLRDGKPILPFHHPHFLELTFSNALCRDPMRDQLSDYAV
jgi:hypothetical protein